LHAAARPRAQQLATYIGWLCIARSAASWRAGCSSCRHRGHHGLSYVYAAFGNVPLIVALFFGLKAAVLAIGWKRVPHRQAGPENNALRALAAAAFVGIFFSTSRFRSSSSVAA